MELHLRGERVIAFLQLHNFLERSFGPVSPWIQATAVADADSGRGDRQPFAGTITGVSEDHAQVTIFGAPWQPEYSAVGAVELNQKHGERRFGIDRVVLFVHIENPFVENKSG